MGKTTEILKFTTQDGEEIQFPVATVTGDQPGPHVVITAGIHGAEYPGIVSAIRIYQELEPKNVHGKVTVVTISSVKAYESRSMFVCPVDGKNPNRFFPGSQKGTYTEVMVNCLFENVISKGDYHLDIHGGDMVEKLEPFSLYHTGAGEEIDKKSKELALYYGLPNLISTSTEGTWPDKGANYANSAEHGIPAVITEVGGIGLLKKDDVEMHLKGMRNVLRYVGVLDEEPKKPEGIVEYDNFVWLYTPVKGLFICDIEIGDELKKGQTVGHMEDFFGEELAEIKAPVDGKVLFLTSSPAMKEQGLIMGTGETA